MPTHTSDSLTRDFIEFAMSVNALQFGEFTLKSGRHSPYFFNAGQFNDGAALATLGMFYAKKLRGSNLEFDLLFGPAYKGIPLALATAMAYHQLYQIAMPYSFNRKEIKSHGEGGQLVGHPVEGRVVIVDDVITAGTAFREAMTLLEKTPASLAGVIIALDRQERGLGQHSAIAEIKQNYQVPVLSIITLQDLIDYLTHHKTLHIHAEKLQNHADSKQP